MSKYLIFSIVLILAFVGIAFFFIKEQSSNSRFPFKFGLDLVGGTELVYRADTSKVNDVGGAMESLKQVIERRVNIFGVSEPQVQTESAGLISGNRDERLLVGLPGVTDIDEAIRLIGQTPILEFRLAASSTKEILATNPNASLNELFIPTGLSRRYLSKARVEFNQNTGAALVAVEFNKEGSDLFADITLKHKGEILGIILDSTVLSAPTIVDEIKDGKAQITGSFTPEQAKELVRNLNYGALPVPISLLTSQTIGATLGESALQAGMYAGLIGFIALAIFMVLWYRLPGLIAVLALTAYAVLSLAIFALVPVTLTAAGIAGFILSVGMAVDANVLIFERTKEELKKGENIRDGLHEGFSRAWLSIRDSNISSIITAIVLFWIGTAAVKGFALTMGIGVLVSMFTAITISRTFLFTVAPKSESKLKRFLFSNGLHVRN